MKLLIAIPSRGRSEAIFKRTLRWVGRTGFDVRVFVEPQELQLYQDAAKIANGDNYTDLTDDQFISIEKNDKGLGYAKGFIKEYALKNKYDLVFKMDDDVTRFNNRGANKPDGMMVVDFAVMVGSCRVQFGKRPEVAAIGFGYRNELYEHKEWVAVNARLQSCYIIRPEYMNSGFSTFEDFAQYVYIRQQNMVTLRYGLLGIDAQEVGSNAGGLQVFDREAMVEKELPMLRKMHPALEFKAVKGKRWSMEPVLTGEFFNMKKL